MLSTNTRFKDIQLREIQRRRDEIKKELTALETKKHKSTAVSTKIAALKKELELSAVLTSPVRGLPPAVLIAIFDKVPRTSEDRRSALAPFVLSQVCRDWRNTAINMPKLWTFIDIRILDQLESESYHTPQKYERAKELANLWFSRAQQLPLTVVLKVFFGDHSWLDALDFMDFILSHKQAANIYSIELDSNNTGALLHDLFPTPPQFPKLNKVLINSEFILPGRCNVIDIYDDEDESFDVFNNAPKLKQLISLSSQTRPSFPLSHQSLMHLIVGTPLSLSLEWINTFSQLKGLQIGVFHLNGPLHDSLQTPAVTYNDLKRLYIYYDGDFPCSSLQSFKFPALEDFRLLFELLLGSRNILYDKIKNVRSLAIRCYGPDPQFDLFTSLGKGFGKLEELEYLTRNDVDIEGFFSLFEVGPGLPPPLLPRLKSLTLRIMRGSHRRWWRVLLTVEAASQAMASITSRWEASAESDGNVSPLNSMHIITDDFRDEDRLRNNDDYNDDGGYNPDGSKELYGFSPGPARNAYFNYDLRKTVLVADRMEIFKDDMRQRLGFKMPHRLR